MPRARIPATESARIETLNQCGILDTPPENIFDDLTKLAARLCETPIALVSLVDSERQWFKSTFGLHVRETHRDSAFCAHAILERRPFIVADATKDPKTLDNPLVTGPPHIRFYAGIPLLTDAGQALGTLCVIDTRPRNLTTQQLADLEALAAQVVSQIELRRLNNVLHSSQKQVQEMHTRLNEIASQVPGLVFQFELRPDGSSGFPYASEGIRSIYRVSPEEVRDDASAVFSVLHPDDYDYIMESIEVSARDLTPWKLEYRVLFPNGDVRWLYGNSIPSRQPNGSICWHGFITDETENRIARDETMVIRSRMQAVVQASTQLSIIATDLDGLITVFNSGAEKMLGYTAEEMIGKQTPQIIHLQSEVEARSIELTQEYGYPVEGFETFVHKARLGGHSESDWTYIRKDGSHLDVRLVVTAMRNEAGEIIGFVGVATDVTEARRTEETLRFQRERLDMALTGGELGTWDLNIQTGEEIWDARFADLLGEELENLTQSSEAFLARMHPDDIEACMSGIRKHLDGLAPIYAAEYRIRQKNGEWRWIQARGRLMQRDQAGRPLRMLGTIADLSSRKQIEDELVAARVLADAANHSKSEFLANMSHEIRTPLTSILGYADRLSGQDLSDEEIAESVETIKNSGSHLLTIINDVLDLSKIEAGKMTIERVPLSPSQLVHEVISVLQPAAQQKGLKLQTRLIGSIPKQIVSDAVRVRQILMNLVGNAVKFTESGSVCLAVQTVQNSPDGVDRMMFEVQDTGIGMTPYQCNQIFQPFMQADASTTRRFGGSGLGLAICRRMAQMLDGEIVAESEYGVGSKFRVTIATGPLDNTEMLRKLTFTDRKLSRAKRPAQTGKIQGRILLAEDNPVNRKLFERILTDAGATVDVAENGQVAVQKAVAAFLPQSGQEDSQQGYDVILMDMQMPVLDGYGATRQLREMRYERPVIALTAHALAEDRRKCMSFGCDDFITKPIDRELLLRTCRKWIEQGRTDHCDMKSKDGSTNMIEFTSTSTVDATELLKNFGDNLELLDELATLFQSNAAELVDAIQQAITDQNCNAIRQAAHSLKGAVSNFASRTALDAASMVESAAANEDLDGAKTAFEKLVPIIDQLFVELREIQDAERPVMV